MRSADDRDHRVSRNVTQVLAFTHNMRQQTREPTSGLIAGTNREPRD